MEERKRRSTNCMKDTPRSLVVENRLPTRIKRSRMLQYTRQDIYRAEIADEVKCDGFVNG